jgi:hypothetical protein
MGLKTRSARNNNFLVVKHGAICREWKPDPDLPPDHEDNQPPKGFVETDVKNPSLKGPNGEDVYVKKWLQKFGSLDGKITGMKWYDTGDKHSQRYMGVKMKIKDDDTYLLDLSFGTQAYDAFTRMAENIDYTKPIEISVWMDKKTTPPKTAFVIRQNGETVKWRYTRDWNENILDTLKHANQPLLYKEFSEAIAKDGPGVTNELVSKMAEVGFEVAPSPVQTMPGKWDFSMVKAYLYRKLVNNVIPAVEELNPAFDEPAMSEDDDVDAMSPKIAAETAAVAAVAEAAPIVPQGEPGQQVLNTMAAPADTPTHTGPPPVAGGQVAPYGPDDDVPF